MDRHIAAYYRNLHSIEEMFDAYERNPRTSEFDAEQIEEILLEWEQLITALRDVDMQEYIDLADEIFEQIEGLQEMLAEIDEKSTVVEEDALIEDANQRLEQDAICNYLDHQLKAKYTVHNSIDEHSARQRLRDKMQPPRFAPMPPPSRLTRNRLSLDEE
ncbi:MAG: hypothetical protein KC496_07205 [Anaerolineae bacterium]|nr:hypothetical protein [Anaerolineae bacterium]